MISTQNWTPDTCECTIEEKHNPSDQNYKIQFSKVIKKCSVHQSISDEELYGILYDNPDGENKRKNLIHKLLLEDDTLQLSEEKTKPNGEKYKDFKQGISYNWSFNGNGKDRVLVVEVKGVNLKQSDKDKIKTYHNFGQGKVEVI